MPVQVSEGVGPSTKNSVLVFYYRRFAREVKRLDGIHRSLLFSHFSESLTGLPTIRAYGETRRFIALNAKLVDLQNRATLLSNSGTQWLLLRLEAMGSLLILAVGLMCTAGGKSVGSGQVALVLTYVVQGTTMLTGLATVATMLEVSSASKASHSRANDSERRGAYLALRKWQSTAGGRVREGRSTELAVARCDQNGQAGHVLWEGSCVEGHVSVSRGMNKALLTVARSISEVENASA